MCESTGALTADASEIFKTSDTLTASELEYQIIENSVWSLFHTSIEFNPTWPPFHTFTGVPRIHYCHRETGVDSVGWGAWRCRSATGRRLPQPPLGDTLLY